MQSFRIKLHGPKSYPNIGEEGKGRKRKAYYKVIEERITQDSITKLQG